MCVKPLDSRRYFYQPLPLFLPSVARSRGNEPVPLAGDPQVYRLNTSLMVSVGGWMSRNDSRCVRLSCASCPWMSRKLAGPPDVRWASISGHTRTLCLLFRRVLRHCPMMVFHFYRRTMDPFASPRYLPGSRDGFTAAAARAASVTVLLPRLIAFWGHALVPRPQAGSSFPLGAGRPAVIG